jgi:autotransporter-associated beta strand protein
MFAALTTVLLIAASNPASEPPAEFFEAKVRPLFIDHCQKCHGLAKQSGGLRLDCRAALRTGGDKGPIVVPGDTAKSRLLDAVRQTGELKMPPTGKLSDQQIELLEAWVKSGAIWPEAENTTRPTEPSSHWAFQAVHAPGIPKTRNASAAISNALDAFILAKLDERGMTMSLPADRATWLRRVTLDLHGFSPTLGALNGTGGAVQSNVAGAVAFTIGNGGAGGSYAGTLANGSGAVSLIKTGAGTQTLSGNNTYGGGTLEQEVEHEGLEKRG